MDISFVLLSGGNATRFGSDKTKALLHNKPLYQYGLECGLALTSDVLHISRDIDKYKPFIEGVSYLADDLENICPMAGMIKAGHRAKYDKVFVLSADSPLFDKDIVKYLYDNMADYDVIIPVINGKKCPLSAMYKKEVLLNMQSDYDKGNYKLVKFLEKYNIKEVGEDELVKAGFDKISFTNVNYTSDLENIKDYRR